MVWIRYIQFSNLNQKQIQSSYIYNTHYSIGHSEILEKHSNQIIKNNCAYLYLTLRAGNDHHEQQVCCHIIDVSDHHSDSLFASYDEIRR
jgi:hypothetical protein